MTTDRTRLIGRKEIQPVIEKLYGITSWRGALNFIERNNMPVCRTETGKTKAGHKAGKPVLFIKELIEFELQNGRSITINDIIIE